MVNLKSTINHYKLEYDKCKQVPKPSRNPKELLVLMYFSVHDFTRDKTRENLWESTMMKTTAI